MSAKEEIKKVVDEGVKQGQAQTGTPNVPLTKKDREEVGARVVAAWYVRLWDWLMAKVGA